MQDKRAVCVKARQAALTLEEAKARIEALEAEVAYLRAEMDARFADSEVVALQKRWKLSPQEAQVLLVLKRACPRHVAEWAIAERIPEKRARSEDGKFVRVHICRLRDKIAKDVIDTVHGAGYALASHWADRLGI